MAKLAIHIAYFSSPLGFSMESLSQPSFNDNSCQHLKECDKPLIFLLITKIKRIDNPPSYVVFT